MGRPVFSSAPQHDAQHAAGREASGDPEGQGRFWRCEMGLDGLWMKVFYAEHLEYQDKMKTRFGSLGILNRFITRFYF